MDKTVTSFSQDFFFFSHSVFFSFFFFCYPTTVTANSAQVHGNWPAPRAGGVGEFGVLKGLRMRTFAVGVKPLFLATLSLLAAELYQWDLFYCSVHFLSSSRSETSSFFFYCYLAENLPSSHASFSIRSLPPYTPSSLFLPHLLCLALHHLSSSCFPPFKSPFSFTPPSFHTLLSFLSSISVSLFLPLPPNQRHLRGFCSSITIADKASGMLKGIQVAIHYCNSL